MTSNSPTFTRQTHNYLSEIETTVLNTVDVWTPDSIPSVQDGSKLWLMWAEISFLRTSQHELMLILDTFMEEPGGILKLIRRVLNLRSMFSASQISEIELLASLPSTIDCHPILAIQPFQVLPTIHLAMCIILLISRMWRKLFFTWMRNTKSPIGIS